MEDLRGKAVLITGAASGIGRASALEFAREGADPLIICDINPEGLKETAAMIGGMKREAIALTVDVSDYDAVKEMVDKALVEAGRIDVLVNVAGIDIGGPEEVLTIEDWRKVLGVNLYGMLHTVNLIYPHMLEKGSGHIANVASGAGLVALSAYNAAYNTSKFGVVGFSESMLLEASARGIGVTCVCPGVVNTPFYDTTAMKGFSMEASELVKKILYVGEEPEATARSMVRAVKKNRFLVVTTISMKMIYYMKRYMAFIWFPLNKAISRGLIRILDRYKTQ